MLREKYNSLNIERNKKESNAKSFVIVTNEYKPTINNKCTMCGKQYKYLTTLKKHYTLQHGNDLDIKDIKTEKISVIISNNNSTKENICVDKEKYIHNNEKTELKCTECNKIYTSKSVLLAHKRNHMQMQCTMCGAKVSRYYLPVHLKTHTDGPQKCPICHQVLKHKRTLKFHMDTVHNSNTNHTNSQQV